MTNLVLDYLMAAVYERSDGAIDFPSEYGESYAFLQSQVYGDAGRFHDQSAVVPWMPRGLIKTDNVQVNYVTAHGAKPLCIALMNECDRELRDVTVTLDLTQFETGTAEAVTTRVWRDNRASDETVTSEKGEAQDTISPKGIIRLVLEGLVPLVKFQEQFKPTPAPAGKYEGRTP